MRYYTGIGSRETPDRILAEMSDIASKLGELGYRLRSGHADGADWAFEQGAAEHQADIFLPWAAFNSELPKSPNHTFHDKPSTAARECAALFHPYWKGLGHGGKSLHARNVHQVLGPDLGAIVLSSFVLCWTSEARGTGGTGQALRIAKAYDVPIFDLADGSQRERVTKLLRKDQ